MQRGIAHQEEVERAAVDADGHPQPHVPGSRVDVAEGAQGRPHPYGGSRRTCWLTVTVEEQQDGVATPLHQSGAVFVGDREQPAEDRAEGVAHLLRADPALAREPLGQGGEAGDVDERQGPDHVAPELVG